MFVKSPKIKKSRKFKSLKITRSTVCLEGGYADLHFHHSYRSSILSFGRQISVIGNKQENEIRYAPNQRVLSVENLSGIIAFKNSIKLDNVLMPAPDNRWQPERWPV